MKRTNITRSTHLLFFLMLSIVLSAQGLEQKGRVKTLGRPNKPGKGIPGVLIKVSEYSNEMLSNQQGAFSFIPKGKTFMLSRVRKNNYQLVDQSMIGRMFPFSVEIPVEIVMVSNQELLSDKQRIEDNAYERAERNYKKRILDLEQQLKRHTISSTDAEKERIRIGENYQRYLNLIGQMAERYATTDFDGISEKNKLILQCIENGELERADSLLNSKGDFNQREAELQTQKQITQKAEELASQSRQAFEMKLNELAQDYYNKHSILTGNYQNDSAAYYLERRARLDTTRIDWMIDAGKFINDYLTDYNRAIRYYRHARSISIKHYGERSIQVANCNNLIGKSFIEQGLYAKAMSNLLEAKMTLESLSQQSTPELADCYANLAIAYVHCEERPFLNTQKALKRTIELIKEIYGDQDIANAKILSLNAEVSIKIGSPLSVWKDIQHAQEFFEGKQGGNLAEKAQTLYDLGVSLSNSEEYAKGQGYIFQALTIWKRQFGEYHPYVSYGYGALADSYLKQKNIKEADVYYTKALDCQKHIFGESHPYIAECQLKLSRLYRKQGDYGTAAMYAMKALDVMLKFDEYHENHVISLLQSIDSWLNTLKVTAHSEKDVKHYYGEFNRIIKQYGQSENKKIRLKKLQI